MRTNMNGIKVNVQETWNNVGWNVPDTTGTIRVEVSEHFYNPFAEEILMWMVFEKPLFIAIDGDLNHHLLCMFTMQALETPCTQCGQLTNTGICYECYQDGLEDPFERGVECAAEEHYGYHSGENYDDDCDDQSEFATIKDKLASLEVK